MQDFRMNTFLAVCKHLNFTKAAEELCITQPAVSQHIRFLEEEYATCLFVRTGKRVQLTPSGELLRNATRTMQHDELRLKEEMDKAALRKSYVFGATLTVAEFLLPHSLPRFIANHRDDHVELRVANTSQLLKHLDDGSIDFAVVEGNFPRDEYASILFSTEPFVAVANQELGRELSGCRFEDMLAQTLVVREEGSGSREILERVLQERSLTLRDFSDVLEIGSIGLTKRLVEQGVGIAFMYRAAIREEEESGRLAAIAISDFKAFHEITFIFPKGTLFEERYRQLYEELVIAACSKGSVHTTDMC
jgi:DNA-binding transcriptional LysR family regulator